MEGLPRKLFLFGGVPAMAALPAFIAAAGGPSAHIAILGLHRQGWERHARPGHEPLLSMLDNGHAQLVTADDDGYLDIESICAVLQKATGIYITGGHTPTYRRLYATEPIRSIIRDRYFTGIPYAGLSAGALLAQDTCIFSSEYYQLEESEIVPGLGLLPGQVIEVHCDDPQRMMRLQTNMAQLGLPGIGINQDGCALFQNEIFIRMLNGSACRYLSDGEFALDAYTGE